MATKKAHNAKKASRGKKGDSAYDRWHSSPRAIAERSSRNQARRIMAKKGLVKKGDGKDVDHVDGNASNNRGKNLKVMSKKANRQKQ